MKKRNDSKDDLKVANAWVGEGEFHLPETKGEELHVVAPKRIESGFRYSLAYSVTDPKILTHARIDEQRPHRNGEACPILNLGIHFLSQM